MTDYVVNNFEAMNQAIDNEAERARGLIELYKVDRQQSKARMFLYVSVGLASLIFSIGLLVWVVMGDVGPPLQVKEGNVDHSKELEKLNVSHSTGERSISTKFTVFISSTTETGDEVITGFNYSPEDITLPVKQYCYLKGADASGAMAGIQLAELDREGGVIVHAESIAHNKLIDYCKFESYLD